MKLDQFVQIWFSIRRPLRGLIQMAFSLLASIILYFINKIIAGTGFAPSVWFILSFFIVLSFIKLLSIILKDREKQKKLSLTDSLTEILNRRGIMIRIDQEHERARRFASTFSLLLLDVDHFKEINDTLGHVIGDLILKELAKVLKNNIREMDDLGRYGGEEFLVLLPMTTLENAVGIAEHLRKSIREHEFLKNVIRVTASFGVINCDQSVDITETLKAVDAAMYKSKLNGRDRVSIAE